MTTSALDIKNQALSEVNSRTLISSESEVTPQAETTALWYDLVVDTVQAAAHFPSGRVQTALAVVQDRSSTSGLASGSAVPEFTYDYAWPEDCLQPWHLTTFAQFEVGYDLELARKYIRTNEANATLVYARRQNIVKFWQPNEKLAVIYGLAAHIAGPLTGKRSLKRDNIAMANQILMEAQTSANNMPQQNMDFTPHRFQAAGYTVGTTTPKFIYPY
ncbi:MAG: hypothetical protein ACPGSC_14060, partial [Granulosicoccaceae bacterium]